jgi:hypothetical protein
MNDIRYWIKHKEKKILVNRYHDLNFDQLVAAVEDNKQAIIWDGQKDLRVLLVFEGSFGNREVVGAFKQASLSVKPYIAKAAVVGVKGVQKFFLNIVNNVSGIGAKAFDEKEEALDWLIEP